MVADVQYKKIDDQGLHVTINDEPQLLEVDTIVVCAGQVSVLDLQASLVSEGFNFSIIGGAYEAAELDAKRAINQGVRLAASL
jgi:2,4-dienoyl-CoA reductase (NADPH2)